MSITVKAYFEKGEAEKEIRRFSVDQDVSSSYTYLSGKITQVFPILASKSFTTSWKDAEGDFIAFSSDEELMQALSCMEDGVFKVFIRASPRGADPSPPHSAPGEHAEGVLHPNVVCDGCEEPVRGVRYKCFVCPDYDLCSRCEDKSIHRQHEMMRICTPRPGISNWMGLGFFPPPPGAFGPPPPGQCPFGGPPPSGPHGPAGPSGPCGPPPSYGAFFGPGGKRGHPRWMRHCNRNGNTEGAQKPTEGKENGQESSSGEPSGPSHSDYLKDVGQRVAAMLDPLGIDVEVDVEHNGERRRCGGDSFRFPWFMGGCGMPGQTQTQTPSQTPGQDKPMDDGQAQGPDTAEVPPADPMTTGQDNSMDTTAPPAARDEETSQIAPDHAETTADSPRQNSAAAPDGDWTLIQDPANTTPSDGNAGEAAAAAPTQSSAPPASDSRVEGTGPARVYPTLPPQQPTVSPRVAQALDHMASMGFTDEGGWLSTLLVVHNGDINRALDAIRAKNK